jgi:hypothetical protein
MVRSARTAGFWLGRRVGIRALNGRPVTACERRCGNGCVTHGGNEVPIPRCNVRRGGCWPVARSSAASSGNARNIATHWPHCCLMKAPRPSKPSVAGSSPAGRASFFSGLGVSAEGGCGVSDSPRTQRGPIQAVARRCWPTMWLGTTEGRPCGRSASAASCSAAALAMRVAQQHSRRRSRMARMNQLCATLRHGPT